MATSRPVPPPMGIGNLYVRDLFDDARSHFDGALHRAGCRGLTGGQQQREQQGQRRAGEIAQGHKRSPCRGIASEPGTNKGIALLGRADARAGRREKRRREAMLGSVARQGCESGEKVQFEQRRLPWPCAQGRMASITHA